MEKDNTRNHQRSFGDIYDLGQENPLARYFKYTQPNYDGVYITDYGSSDWLARRQAHHMAHMPHEDPERFWRWRWNLCKISRGYMKLGPRLRSYT